MADITQLESSGKYREAIDALQQTPTYDANYFYNLGILWGKMNQPGMATAYLEKANRLKPHDPEILHNLKMARTQFNQQLLNQHSELSPDAASNQFEQFSDRIQSDEILGVMGLVTLIVSLLWVRAYLKTRNITKTFLKPSGWFGVFALIMVSAFYGIYKAGNLHPPAVITLKQPLRSGPGMNYPEITSIEPGIKVRIMGTPVSVNENELWQKIRYKSDQTAWIPLSGLLPL